MAGLGNTDKKVMILVISALILSIEPVNASQISGTNGTFDNSITEVENAQNNIINKYSTTIQDFGPLLDEAKKCDSDNVPWYVWLGGLSGVAIYLGVHIYRVKSMANDLKDKFQNVDAIKQDLNGTKYGLESKNETARASDSPSEYISYMDPKIEASTGYSLVSKENSNLKVGDIVLYKSKNLYYRYLYVSSIDRKNGNYILRGMNNKPFVKSSSDVDGNVKIKFNIASVGNVTRDDDEKVVNAAYNIQENEFINREDALVQLKDISRSLTLLFGKLSWHIRLCFDGIHVALAWLDWTGTPEFLNIIEDTILMILDNIINSTIEPITDLASDLLAYYDLEIPDLQEYFQPYEYQYPAAYNMNFNTSNKNNLTANLNATGSSILNYQITTSPSSGYLKLCPDHGGYNSTFIYEPDPNYAGNVTFKYDVYDGLEKSDEATVTIEVNKNHNPLAKNMTIPPEHMNEAANGNLNVTDPDGDKLTYCIGNNTRNGTLTIDGNGNFVYTPNHNFIGNDSFTYWATDGYLNSSKITIKFRVDNPPVVENMEFNLPKNKIWDIPYSKFKATDMGGNKLQFKVFKAKTEQSTPDDESKETYGNLKNIKDSWIYYPLKQFTGIIKFHYQAFDGMFLSYTANITLNYTDIFNYNIYLISFFLFLYPNTVKCL